tara:strand:+ start:772 stop:1035 length:264 start_codon:yes stop_codon:yes gene_type:complete
MLDTNEMTNMMNFIREKTTRCRADIANVFDRITELDSIANALEQQIQQETGSSPISGQPMNPTEIHNVNDLDDVPSPEDMELVDVAE